MLSCFQNHTSGTPNLLCHAPSPAAASGNKRKAAALMTRHTVWKNLPLCFTKACSESQRPLSGSFYRFRLFFFFFFLRTGICACSFDSFHSVWDMALHMLSGQRRADTHVNSEKQSQLTLVFSNPRRRLAGRRKEGSHLLGGCLS